MGTFKATDIEPIGWDMRLSPKMNPETGEPAGKWTNSDPLAKGTITEPTEAQVQAYIDGRNQVMAAAAAASDDEADQVVAEIRKAMTELLVEIGFPAAMLAQLSPRYFRGLESSVYQELIEGN